MDIFTALGTSVRSGMFEIKVNVPVRYEVDQHVDPFVLLEFRPIELDNTIETYHQHKIEVSLVQSGRMLAPAVFNLQDDGGCLAQAQSLCTC
jgi:hypothetical protein